MDNTLHQEIKELFSSKTISAQRFRKFFDNVEYVQYVSELYPTVNVSYDNRQEIGFLIKNDLSGPPVCNADGCTSQIQFKKGRYREFCGYSCSAKQRTTESFEKAKQTSIEKYGVTHFSKTEDFIEKMKQTSLEKFGVEHYAKTEEFVNRVKSTNLEKYGVEHPAQSDEIKDRLKKISKKKYKCSFPQQKDYNMEIISIFDDKDQFKKLLYEYGVFDLAELVNCHSATIHKFAKKFNIKLPVRNQSQDELEIKKLLDDNEIAYSMNDRSIISPLELDFYLPDYKIAFEINGLYWHSERLKQKNYHYNKWEQCRELGITLFSIFEDDLNSNAVMWKSKILHLCGKTDTLKLYARKCDIKEVDSTVASKFLNENHLQGKCNSKYKLGLYYDGILVSLMTFQNTRNNQDNIADLNRFCTKIGYQVIGGASKLLSHFIKTYGQTYNEIVQFSDNQYSDGTLYNTLGFELQYEIPPDYKYIVNGKREHKSNYRKNLIQKKFNLPNDYVRNTSEKVLMEEQGIYRIYDCGKKKWVLPLSL